PSNWSLGHVPTSTEIAKFSSQSSLPCVIDNSEQDTASGIFISNDHFGNISLLGNLTLGSDGFYHADSPSTFMAGSNTTILDAGNWFEGSLSGFEADTCTVNFNGANGQSLDSGGSVFWNVIHSGLSQLQLNNDLTVKQFFTNSANTFDVNNFNLTVG